MVSLYFFNVIYFEIGVYQLRFAKSYIHDKVQREADFKFKMTLTEPGLLHANLYSRFSSAKKHSTWIKFKESWEPNEQIDEEDNPIEGYYCSCKSGARTVGCCGHVASLLWYLSYARHLPTVPTPQVGALHYILDAPDRPHVNVLAPTI